MLLPVVSYAVLTVLAILAARNAGRYWRAQFGKHPKPPTWWAYGPTLWRANLVAAPSWAAAGVCLILGGWAMIAGKLGLIPMSLATPILGIGVIGLLGLFALGIVAALVGRPKSLILPGLRSGPFLLSRSERAHSPSR
jgi:hypothetical protein